jgi:hypothetical protein
MGASVNTYGDLTKYKDGTPEERQEQFRKDLEKMTWNSSPPPYSDMLTADDKKKVAKRLEEVKGAVIHAGTAPAPVRTRYLNDETYAQGIKEREAAILKLKEMTKVIPLEEAKKIREKYKTKPSPGSAPLSKFY